MERIVENTYFGDVRCRTFFDGEHDYSFEVWDSLNNYLGAVYGYSLDEDEYSDEELDEIIRSQIDD